MKASTLGLFVWAACACALVSFSSAGHAEQGDERTRQSVRSIRGELFGTSLPRVRWLRGKGNPSEALAGLGRVAGYARGAEPHGIWEGSKLRASDDQWDIEAEDASGALHRKRGSAAPRPAVERWSNSQAFTAARDVVARMDTLLPRTQGEGLMPERAIHEMGLSGDTQGHQETHWRGTKVLFSRTVDGLPVLGGEHPVELDFDSEGALVHLRYSWPRLARTTLRQKTQPSAKVFARLRPLRAGAASTPLSIPAMSGAFVPFSLDEASTLQDFRCGYTLPQDDSASEGTLETGCQAEVVTLTSGAGAGKFRSVSVIDIPIGEP